MVGKFTSISAGIIVREYPEVKRELWRGHFCQVGYYGPTVGDAVTAEVIRGYIQHCQTEETTPKQPRLSWRSRPQAGELHYCCWREHVEKTQDRHCRLGIPLAQL